MDETRFMCRETAQNTNQMKAVFDFATFIVRRLRLRNSKYVSSVWRAAEKSVNLIELTTTKSDSVWRLKRTGNPV